MIYCRQISAIFDKIGDISDAEENFILKDNNYKIKIIKVRTLKEAISYLKK